MEEIDKFIETQYDQSSTSTYANRMLKKEMYEEVYNGEELIGYRKFQQYDGVVVGTFEDANHNVGTIFPDAAQREVDE